MKNFIESMAQEAGELALSYWRTSSIGEEYKERNEKDVVTRADKEIETLLRKRILEQYPDHSILGEEQGTTGSGEHRWILDPIDGTASFAHGQRNFSISIAYEYRGQVVAAAVYAPAHQEFFYAEKGEGTTLNGNAVHVSDRKDLGQSMMATGFACLRAGAEKNNLPNFCRVAPRIRGIRRLGSAALDLAYVSCGQFDGFWEMMLNSYDIAAGCLLVEEAGGRISDYNGTREGIPDQVVATNGKLHGALLDLLE